MKARCVLFTNLRSVGLETRRDRAHEHGLVMFAHALLLEEYLPDRADELASASERARREIRGFGTDPSWSVFTLGLSDSIAYELVDLPRMADAIAAGHKITSKLLRVGAPAPPPVGFDRLREVELYTEDQERPIDVQLFEGERSEVLTGPGGVWEKLPLKVAEYWRAPNMPRPVWAPPWLPPTKLHSAEEFAVQLRRAFMESHAGSHREPIWRDFWKRMTGSEWTDAMSRRFR